MATQRELAMLVGGLVGGAVVAGVVAVVGFGFGLGHTESTIALRPEGPNSACTITGKETEVRVGKNKKLTWKVLNFCEQEQKLAVGNFRAPTEISIANDCTAAVLGNVVSPFRQDAQADREIDVPPKQPNSPRPGEKKLQLKVKPEGGDEGLPDQELTYLFDICLGGQKADPRLIVER